MSVNFDGQVVLVTVVSRFLTLSYAHSAASDTLQPPGGVEKDEIFDGKPSSAKNAPPPATKGTGRWKTGLCYVRRITHVVFWNAWCCPHLLVSQILARLATNQPKDHEPRSYQRLVAVFLAACLLDFLILAPLFESTSDSSTLILGYDRTVWMEALYLIWSAGVSYIALSAVVRLRARVREQHAIDTGCLGRVEDAACVLCCHQCVLVQMAEQTADYDVEEAACCTNTGLASAKCMDLCLII